MTKQRLGFIANLLPWLSLIVLISFTYPRINRVPYSGFQFDPASGRVGDIFVQGAPGAGLRLQDRIIQLDSLKIADYQTDLRLTYLNGVQPGQVVPILIERGGETLTIPWAFPGYTWGELQSRLINVWWLAYVFWFFGTITWLIVRPRDVRQILLTLFNYLTALWVVTGSLSSFHVWNSALIMRMAFWMSLPVYWHLHWVFPKPLKSLPKWVWGGFYAVATGLAILQWFQRIDRNAYFLGFLLAVVGSVVLLIVHFIVQPGQRREIGLLAIAVSIAVLPPALISVVSFLGNPLWYNGIAVLSLYALPGAYFYIIYRRQLGGLEVRANRVIASYIFFILLGSLFLVGVPLVIHSTNNPDLPLITALVAPFLATLITAFGLIPFQRWAEQKLLGMPLPPTQLVETYTARITTALDQESLISLLREQILPTLLVRQAALLRLDEELSPAKIFTLKVEDSQLPGASDIPHLLSLAGQYRPLADQQTFPWVHLILPLMVDGKPVGLCLLGRRDPDDVYALSEIPALQALMNQTALGLVNIEQSERLCALYQADMEREEAERSRLAHVLHDDVLHQMSLLSLRIDGPTDQFQAAYNAATDHIRQIISGLRPTMLNYGLYSALTELADETLSQLGSDVKVVLDLPASEVRYTPEVELHLYRIVQQACQNAIKHAHPSQISITGWLEQDQAELTVSDNGIGFEAKGSLDFNRLLAGKHFGLAGMYERAALIGAQLSIDSAPQKGTRVRVRWAV